MDQRDLVTLSLAGGTWLHHPDTWPYGPLSGAAKTPLGPDQVNVLLLCGIELQNMSRVFRQCGIELQSVIMTCRQGRIDLQISRGLGGERTKSCVTKLGNAKRLPSGDQAAPPQGTGNPEAKWRQAHRDLASPPKARP
jgi:hypothetical protein